MEALQLATQESFNGITCDFYNRGDELLMTRNQIGTALGYDKPSDSIEVIHRRHRDRLDKFSATDKLTGTDGKSYNTYLYSEKGIFEICRWSRQPKADAFMDWVWNIVESYRNGKLTANSSSQITVQQAKEITDTINDLSSGFNVLCKQINSMENAFDNQFMEFKQEIDRLQNIFKDGQHESKVSLEEIKYPLSDYFDNTIQPIKVDPIRNTIKPLAEIYNDKSVGYNNTYRKVYAAMPVDWKRRKTIYKNKNGNKNRPSKLHLLEEDAKLLSMFVATVNRLMTEVQA